jgi:hypothetical protein
MSSILQWCGRFGNNIQQISNAIFYCQENKLNFISPESELINPFNINFNTINKECPPGLYFFHVPSEIVSGIPDFNIDVNKLKLKRREVCNFIYNNLKINFNNIKPLDEDTLVIHIRSGDIFSKKNYHCPVVSNYLQNPLKYYTDIIVNYKKVIILTEDYENPVIPKLSKINKIDIKVLPILETIEIMLSAKNLVTSGVSSFPIACALLSKNIKKIYCSNLYLNEIINYHDLIYTDINVTITQIDQDKYIKWNEWLNTSAQRERMITYA